jgi:hypothetical protein
MAKIISLVDFLTARDITKLEKDIAISTEGGVFSLTVSALSEDELNKIRKEHTTVINKSTGAQKTNADAVKLDVIIKGTVSPCFNDADLLEKLGFADPITFLKSKFLPGELDNIYAEIAELSGYNSDINTDIEETVKN